MKEFMDLERKARGRVEYLAQAGALPEAIRDRAPAPLLDGVLMDRLASVLDRVEAAVVQVAVNPAVPGRRRRLVARPTEATGRADGHVDEDRDGQVVRPKTTWPGEGPVRRRLDETKPIGRVARSFPTLSSMRAVVAEGVWPEAAETSEPRFAAITPEAAAERLRLRTEQAGAWGGWDRPVILSPEVEVAGLEPVAATVEKTKPSHYLTHLQSSSYKEFTPGEVPVRDDTPVASSTPLDPPKPPVPTFAPGLKGLRGLAALAEPEGNTGESTAASSGFSAVNRLATAANPDSTTSARTAWPIAAQESADVVRLLTETLRREARRHGIDLEDVG